MVQRDMQSSDQPGGTSTVQGTQAWLRGVNDQTALSLLFDHGPLTRARLGDLTGLSKPTAGQMISRLEVLGLVRPVGRVSAGRGPNAIAYGVRAERMLGVAVDVSQDGLRASLVDVLGSEFDTVSIARPEPSRADAEDDLRDAIIAVCRAGDVSPDDIHACCVGVQGSFDPVADRLTFADHLPRWRHTAVRARLEKVAGAPVLIDNDVNLATVAEQDAGAGQGIENFVLVWLGRGLGMGLVLQGKLLRGSGGSAGEIGWIAPDRSFLSEAEGRATDLEALLGGTALEELAAEHGTRPGDFEDAVRALADAPADSPLVAAYAPRVAAAVRPVLAILDPDVVVLGGPSGWAGGTRLSSLVRSRLEATAGWTTSIMPTEVAGNPVLRGAQVMLRQTLREQMKALITASDDRDVPLL